MTIETLEGGNNDGALLLGVEEGDRVFWDYRDDILVKEGVSETYPLGEEFVGDYITDSYDEGLWGRSSELGAFLGTVASHQDATGMIGEKQAIVYALRDMAGISRTHTARALNSSPSTIDSTLSTARAKIDAFRAVADSLD